MSATLKRFFRSPKGLLLIVLALLAAVSGIGAGVGLVAPGMVAALATGALIDAPMLRFRRRRWIFPDGALLTALIIAMILDPQEPWYVVAITTAIAVLSKYVIRSGPANVFNPAALGLVASYFIFNTEQSWWGALPELPTVVTILLLATGMFITVKVSKIPVVLAFLGSYYLLTTLAAFAGDPAQVAELYRTPDLQAALFFAFFMVSDPPTSPPKHRDQVIFGVITAVTGFAVFELIGAVYYMLAGLLVANVWEAWRRQKTRSVKREARSEKPEAGSGMRKGLQPLDEQA